MKELFRDVFVKIMQIATSRRFWAAVAASVPFGLSGDWVSFSMVWAGYGGLIGAQDIAESLRSEKEA
jgi:hypothetical protein